MLTNPFDTFIFFSNLFFFSKSSTGRVYLYTRMRVDQIFFLVFFATIVGSLQTTTKTATGPQYGVIMILSIHGVISWNKGVFPCFHRVYLPSYYAYMHHSQRHQPLHHHSSCRHHGHHSVHRPRLRGAWQKVRIRLLYIVAIADQRFSRLMQGNFDCGAASQADFILNDFLSNFFKFPFKFSINN